MEDAILLPIFNDDKEQERENSGDSNTNSKDRRAICSGAPPSQISVLTQLSLALKQ